jgi:hypothetical protein
MCELWRILVYFQLSLQHDRLADVQQERDQLHMALLQSGHTTEQEIVQQAQQERDFAIEK